MEASKQKGLIIYGDEEDIIIKSDVAETEPWTNISTDPGLKLYRKVLTYTPTKAIIIPHWVKEKNLPKGLNS